MYVKFVSEAAAGQGFKALHGWMYDGRNPTWLFPNAYVCVCYWLLVSLSAFSVYKTDYDRCPWENLRRCSCGNCIVFVCVTLLQNLNRFVCDGEKFGV